MPLHHTPDGLPPGFVTGMHPGRWELHHIALPVGGPKDFTPCPVPEYAEETIGLHEPLLRLLGELLDIDHAKGIDRRGLAAGHGLDREAGE
jgi:hypothetical protein